MYAPPRELGIHPAPGLTLAGREAEPGLGICATSPQRLPANSPLGDQAARSQESSVCSRECPSSKNPTPSLPPVRCRQAARPKRTLELVKILSTLNRHPTLTYYVLDPGDGRRGDRGTPQSGVRKHGPGHSCHAKVQPRTFLAHQERVGRVHRSYSNSLSCLYHRCKTWDPANTPSVHGAHDGSACTHGKWVHSGTRLTGLLGGCKVLRTVPGTK